MQSSKMGRSTAMVLVFKCNSRSIGGVKFFKIYLCMQCVVIILNAKSVCYTVYGSPNTPDLVIEQKPEFTKIMKRNRLK